MVYDNMTPKGLNIKEWLYDLGFGQGYSDISWKYTDII